MAAKTILFLDIATQLGWACGAPGAEPEHGSVSLRSTSSHPGAKLCMLVDWLHPVLIKHKPGRVIFEAPLMMMPAKDGAGRGGNSATLEFLISAVGQVKMMTCRQDIPVLSIASSTVRKWFVGHGRPENPKEAVMTECRRRGWIPVDDNDADALAGWDWACGAYYPNDYRRSYRNPAASLQLAKAK